MVATYRVRRLGRAVQDRAGRVTGLTNFPVFLGRVLYYIGVDIIWRRKYGKVVLRHVSDIVIGAGAYVAGGGMVFVILVLAFAAGSEIGLQSFPGLERIGVESFMGVVASFANVRELTPIITAVALIAQVGSSFTAEIGAMRISEEIDALEVMGIHSIGFLVCTRIVAAVIALIPLYLFSLFASFFATRLISTQFFGLSPGVYDYYFHLYLPPIDVLYSVIKMAIFAFVIVLIHCYRGFYAVGGPVGVGVAAGRGIRDSSVAIVMLNLVLSYIFWGHGGTVRLTG